jgi:hypothetical protein
MIFGIGLSRTGTTSLCAALQQLGFVCGTFPHLRDRALHNWFSGDFSTDYLSGFSAMTDLPLAAYYPELNRRYPGSKFILTTRDIESWLESTRRHFERDPHPAGFVRDVRLVTYGITGYERERFRYVYQAHYQSVRRYFHHRPEVLLEMNIVNGDGWNTLCPFLGRNVPTGVQFPRLQQYEMTGHIRRILLSHAAGGEATRQLEVMRPAEETRQEATDRDSKKRT